MADGDGGVPRSSTAVAGISLQFAGRVYIIPLSRDFRCFGVFFSPFPVWKSMAVGVNSRVPALPVAGGLQCGLCLRSVWVFILFYFCECC